MGLSRAAGIGLVLALSFAFSPAGARLSHAQRDEGVSLSTGFVPDPVRLEGETGGRTPLSSRAPGCRGYVGTEPSERLRLETSFGFLRLFVDAAEDVTLAVHGPDGRWRCSGHPLEGAPREQGEFAAGTYEVWIGSLGPGGQVPYELLVTEFRSVTPAIGHGRDNLPTGGGAALGLAVRSEEGRFRGRRLRRGFLPDPREDEGEAGGPISLGLLGGGCRGFVDARPNHVLTLRSAFDYFRIQVVGAPGQTSLTVRTPEAAWLCSAPDDAAASVDRESWRPGRYLIWVGSLEEHATPAYRIRYTETRPSQP